jgi:hypothetical protein
MTETSIPRVARQLLMAATVFLGIAMAMLAWNTTAIGAMLFMNHEIAHGRTVAIEHALAWMLLGVTVLMLWPPTRVFGAVLLLVFAVVLAWANVDQGGYPFSRFAYGAHAMRIAAPLALVFAILQWGPLEPVRRRIVLSVLIAASATTFVIHGVEAFAGHPWFTDMTLNTFRTVGGWRISQASAENLLRVVGVIDIMVSIALIVFRAPWVAGWMAGWGLFTAFLRPLNYGAGAWVEFIVRLPHFLLPLVLVVLLRGPRTETVPQPSVLPAS